MKDSNVTEVTNVTELSVAMKYALIGVMTKRLVRSGIASERQALGTSVVFAENYSRLVTDPEEFMYHFPNQLDEVKVNEESLSTFPVLEALKTLGYLDVEDGQVQVGSRTLSAVESHSDVLRPILASIGITQNNRVMNYGVTGGSSLTREAIHHLEQSKMMRSDVMLDIITELFRTVRNDPTRKAMLMNELYVLKGTREMDSGVAYVCEHKGDSRDRLYQVPAHGPNGQSSDLARALYDFHGVPTDYNANEVLAELVVEAHDMGSWESDQDFEVDLLEASSNSVQFLVEHMVDHSHMKKPYNFVKFSKLIVALRAGERPYVGVAVGLDAKGSGPQIGGIYVQDESIMRATGFTLETVFADIYVRARLEMDKLHLPGNVTRQILKDLFVMIFYGSGADNLFNLSSVEQYVLDAVFSDCDGYDEHHERAVKVRDAISASFGSGVKQLRAKFTNAGWDFENECSKIDSPVEYYMADGVKIAMQYFEKTNIDGDVINRDVTASNVVVDYGNGAHYAKKFNVETNDYDLGSYGRKGFVNFIQATDALLARLILVNCERLGVTHIVSIHDCFRVNVTQLPLLREAIKEAYRTLFLGNKDEVKDDLPLGIDGVNLYFSGFKNSVKPEYQDSHPSHTLFYGNGYNKINKVNGVYFSTLINSLGEGSSYFSK